MKKIILLLLMLVLISSVNATTWYVATNGSNTNIGTDIHHPLLTISQGWTNATAGDTIQVMGAGINAYGGTYQFQTSSLDLSGKPISAGSFITLEPYNNQVINLTFGVLGFETHSQVWQNYENVTGTSTGTRCIWNTTYTFSGTELYAWIMNGSNTYEQIFTPTPSDKAGRTTLYNSTYPAVFFFNATPSSNEKIELAIPNCSWNPNTVPLLVTRLTGGVLIGNNTILRGFNILGGKSAIYSSTTKMGKNVVIDNNFILGQRGIDIRENAENITIVNNGIITNRQNWSWQMVKDHSTYMEKDGVYFDEVVTGVNVTGNKIKGFFNGIYFDSSSTGKFLNAVVENNNVSDILDDALEFEDYGNCLKVKGNKINDSFSGISLSAFDSNECRSNISYNIVDATKTIWQYSTGTQGIGYCFKTMGDGAMDINKVDFIHNTLIGRGIYASSNTNSQLNTTWIDNIFYNKNSASDGYLIYRTGLETSNVSYDYNVYNKLTPAYYFKYWDSDADATVYNSLALAKSSGRGVSWDIHSVDTNPLFYSYETEDYRPNWTDAVCLGSSTGSYVGALPCLGNTAPTISSSTILNSTAYTNTNLIGECNATDLEGDTLSYSYNWYRNTTLINLNSTLLGGSNFSKGDWITFYCNVTDNTNPTVYLNSSVVTILNSPPSTPTISVADTTITYNSTDADGDGLSYFIYLNDTLYDTTTLLSYIFGLGDGSYNSTVEATDGTVNSSMSDYIYFGVNGCGDGVINGDEQCDLTNTNGYTCEDFGYNRGTLSCSVLCTFDTSTCERVNVYVDSLYNTTAASNSENIAGFISSTNNGVGQLFMSAFLLAFFFIFVMALKRYPMEDVFPAVSFVFFVISIFLRQAALVTFYLVVLFFFFLAGSVAYHYIKGEQ